jgi:hypothetical protein
MPCSKEIPERGIQFLEKDFAGNESDAKKMSKVLSKAMRQS